MKEFSQRVDLEHSGKENDDRLEDGGLHHSIVDLQVLLTEEIFVFSTHILQLDEVSLGVLQLCDSLFESIYLQFKS